MVTAVRAGDARLCCRRCRCVKARIKATLRVCLGMCVWSAVLGLWEPGDLCGPADRRVLSSGWLPAALPAPAPHRILFVTVDDLGTRPPFGLSPTPARPGPAAEHGQPRGARAVLGARGCLLGFLHRKRVPWRSSVRGSLGKSLRGQPRRRCASWCGAAPGCVCRLTVARLGTRGAEPGASTAALPPARTRRICMSSRLLRITPGGRDPRL